MLGVVKQISAIKFESYHGLAST